MLQAFPVSLYTKEFYIWTQVYRADTFLHKYDMFCMSKSIVLFPLNVLSES